jgi:2-keto-3-deoxy-6-phosphogluconate aldolase
MRSKLAANHVAINGVHVQYKITAPHAFSNAPTRHARTLQCARLRHMKIKPTTMSNSEIVEGMKNGSHHLGVVRNMALERVTRIRTE